MSNMAKRRAEKQRENKKIEIFRTTLLQPTLRSGGATVCFTFPVLKGVTCGL